jgi:hypothetical protein
MVNTKADKCKIRGLAMEVQAFALLRGLLDLPAFAIV